MPRAKKRRALEKVVQELSQLLAVQPQVLRSADRTWGVSQARTKIGYILVRRQGYALRYFARDLATIGTLIGRLSGRMEEDERMRGEIETLTKKVEI